MIGPDPTVPLESDAERAARHLGTPNPQGFPREECVREESKAVALHCDMKSGCKRILNQLLNEIHKTKFRRTKRGILRTAILLANYVLRHHAFYKCFAIRPTKAFELF